MDSSSSSSPDQFSTGSSSPSRKEIQIQGPRPSPLKVRKDSYKIKKPPLAPQLSQLPPPQGQPQTQTQSQPQPQRPPPRRPVIIYTVSPKVIHTTASDFMTLVQRLTGPNSTSSSSYTTVQPSSSSASSSYVDNNDTVLASPAARFATIEKANRAPCSQGEKSRKGGGSGVDVMEVEGLEEGINRGGASGTVLERQSFFPGILSPVPSSLPPISPNFFSPTIPRDPNSSLAFLQDLSPMFHGNRNFIEGTMVPSPTSLFSSSPTPFMDLFNQFDS